MHFLSNDQNIRKMFRSNEHNIRIIHNSKEHNYRIFFWQKSKMISIIILSNERKKRKSLRANRRNSRLMPWVNDQSIEFYSAKRTFTQSAIIRKGLSSFEPVLSIYYSNFELIRSKNNSSNKLFNWITILILCPIDLKTNLKLGSF